MTYERAKRMLETAGRNARKGNPRRAPGDAFGIWKNHDPLGIWEALPWQGEPKEPELTPAQKAQEDRREMLENRSIGSKVTTSLPAISFDGMDRVR